MILKHFWRRWKLEYLTSLREFHKTTGNNIQQVRIGDVVLVHDDTPRINWQLAVIEDVIRGSDGLIRAANIRTKAGRTNRPIARLYPLEVRSTDTLKPSLMIPDKPQPQPSDTASEEQATQPSARQTRSAALKARKKLRDWTEVLRAPPEDVEN